MDITNQVAKWVEKKFGKVINNHLKQKIQEEDSAFDVEAYTDEIFKNYFEKNDVKNIKREIFDDYDQYNFSNSETDKKSDFYSVCSNDGSLDSLELDQNDLNTCSIEDIISGLKSDSIENQISSLKLLEASVDDLINPTNWVVIRKVLENILLRAKKNAQIQNLILKIFQKLIFCPNKPQMVCEGFVTLTEIASFHIEILNLENGRISFEEIYDFKKEKWLRQTPPESEKPTNGPHDAKSIDTNVAIKSMWLLIECQKQMPEKWIRFNEKRLREIIFSFVHLLSYTTTHENKKLTGLELLSVLNPTATWCKHWCHTAVGRSLLCSALRKYKNLFVQIIEVIIFNMKVKKIEKTIAEDPVTLPSVTESNHSPALTPSKQINESDTKKDGIYLHNDRNKVVRSAPIVPEKVNSPRKINDRLKSKKSIFENIPVKIITQAVFYHCVSLVVCLVQYRSGRSLFPVQTSSRKRLLSVQDLAASMADYLENSEYYDYDNKKVLFTHEYRRQVLEMIKILKNVKNTIHSSRTSADRLPPCPL